MTNAKKLLLPAAALVMLLLIIAWMAGFFSDKIAPGLEPAETFTEADTVPVIARDTPILEAVPASVEAKQATLISSRIMARIKSIPVRSGDSVSEGQLLIALEKTDLQARAGQAAEQVRAVAARLREAQQNLTRMQQLRAQGLVALADLDRARANYNALQAEQASAQRAKEEAETAVNFADIRAPIAGRVVDRFAEPGDTATPGSKLLSLYNPLSLRVEAQVREQLALSLTLDQPLTVEIPALQLSVAAQVEELVPAAEPGSRSFLVKAAIPYQPRLLPGMYARLLLPAGNKQQLMIPSDRIAQVGQLDVVWVLEDGRPARRFIRTGKTLEGYTEVTSGLSSGERLLPVH